MIRELIIAILKAGIPVAIASYVLVWWGLKKDHLGTVLSLKDLEKEVKRQKKDKENKAKGDLVHNKWLAFGGGFYGLVGLLTYVVVELGEIRDFFMQFESIGALISALSIDLVFSLFIDAVTNFIVAIAWPVYWMSDIAGEYIWIWLGVAYGGYLAGAKYALHRMKDTIGENRDGREE
jgi:hypothetical protein